MWVCVCGCGCVRVCLHYRVPAVLSLGLDWNIPITAQGPTTVQGDSPEAFYKHPLGVTVQGPLLSVVLVSDGVGFGF